MTGDFDKILPIIVLAELCIDMSFFEDVARMIINMGLDYLADNYIPPFATLRLVIRLGAELESYMNELRAKTQEAVEEEKEVKLT